MVSGKEEAQATVGRHEKVNWKNLVSSHCRVKGAPIKLLAGCLPANTTSAWRALVDYGGGIVMVSGKEEAQARVDRHQKVNWKRGNSSV